jgi:hypothetical protein
MLYDVIIIQVEMLVRSGYHLHFFCCHADWGKQVVYNQIVLQWRPSLSQSLVLLYTPNQKDYATVLRYFYWQRTGTKVSLVFLAVAFGLILYMIASKGSPLTFFELIWLLLPPLFVIYVFFLQPSRLANKAVQNEQLVTEATWIVSDAGVQISSRFGSDQLDWESLNKLLTTKDYYLLLSKANKNAFRFLPRRAFISPKEEEQFLELVGGKISAG